MNTRRGNTRRGNTPRGRGRRRVIGITLAVLAGGLLVRLATPGPAAAGGGWPVALWLSATAWAAPPLGVLGLFHPRLWLAAATLAAAALGLALYAPGFGAVGAVLGLICLRRAPRP